MWKRVLAPLTLGSLVALLALAGKSMFAGSPADKENLPVPKEGSAAEAARAPAPETTTPGVKLASSRITGVTVYSNSALVTREVDVPDGRGIVELTVSPLPPTTVYSSLYTEGNDSNRILTTRFRSRPVKEDTREEVRKIEDELKKIQLTQQKVKADLEALKQAMGLYTKLENFTSASTQHATEKGKLDSDATIALAKYLIDSRAEKTREMVTLTQQEQTNAEQLEYLARKLSEMTSGPSKTERDAVIVVDKTNGAAGKVKLNYLVDEASWRPQYKLRAGKLAKDQGEWAKVKLEYLAAVTQHTGEDWSNVELVLSTAQPTLNAAPPDLQVLKVTTVARGANPQGVPMAPGEADLQEQVKSLRSKAAKDFNQKKAASGAGLVNTAAALDQSWELLNPEAAVSRGCSLAVREGPSVTYHLGSKLSVPSRNDEQVLEVARLDLAPDYFYKAVPILTSHVYRLADLTNKSNYVLLPGEATMYVGTDFVGQMNLPMVAIGEQFTVGFGIDPQLQVHRQMIDKNRTTQGGNQILRYEYRILVNSFKQERVRLQVWDRLPHAETETIGVSLVKAVPEISADALYQREQRPNNLLRWDVQVDPAMTGEKALAIKYEFRLELERNMSIGSFQTSGVAHAETPLPAAPAAAAGMPGMSAEDMARIKANLAKLSPEDRRLAEAQVFCAIDQDSPLGMDGVPFKMMIKERPVFLCCKGCVAEAKAHPDQAIVMLDKLMARLRTGAKK
jgi:uncharacterized protein (TIGR02231 family)